MCKNIVMLWGTWGVSWLKPYVEEVFIANGVAYKITSTGSLNKLKWPVPKYSKQLLGYYNL